MALRDFHAKLVPAGLKGFFVLRIKAEGILGVNIGGDALETTRAGHFRQEIQFAAGLADQFGEKESVGGNAGVAGILGEERIGGVGGHPLFGEYARTVLSGDYVDFDSVFGEDADYVVEVELIWNEVTGLES